jgi:hypothetical protein
VLQTYANRSRAVFLSNDANASLVLIYLNLNQQPHCSDNALWTQFEQGTIF